MIILPCRPHQQTLTNIFCCMKFHILNLSLTRLILIYNKIGGQLKLRKTENVIQKTKGKPCGAETVSDWLSLKSVSWFFSWILIVICELKLKSYYYRCGFFLTGWLISATVSWVRGSLDVGQLKLVIYEYVLANLWHICKCDLMF